MNIPGDAGTGGGYGQDGGDGTDTGGGGGGGSYYFTGGTGGAAGVGGAGAGGHGGVAYSAGVAGLTLLAGSYLAESGDMGGDSSSSGGGGGGAGGFGSYKLGPNAYIEFGAGVTFSGGNGGGGGASNTSAGAVGSVRGGGGGDGGIGVYFTDGSELRNAGTVRGGNGGDGGGASAITGTRIGGAGGDGGAGVMAVSGTLIGNSGSIIGGDGGAGGVSATNGVDGLGGAGIVGSNLTITTSGTISGGVGGDGTTRANAITFTGGANSLAIATTAIFTGDISVTGSLALAQATDATLGAAIVGTGFVTKTGAGVLTLSEATTYSGPTGVFAGTLRAGAENVFSAASGFSVSSGATLDLGGFDNTIGGLAGPGSVTNSGSADAILTVSTPGFEAFNGTISDGATNTTGLTKAGTGRLDLTGTNTYTGATHIEEGTLRITSDTALNSTTALTIDAGAGLDLNGLIRQVSVGSIAGDGAIYGTNGVLQFLAWGTDNTDTTFGGTIDGDVIAASKLGTGTTTLTGANDFQTLIIGEGAIKMGAGGALGDEADVALFGTAELDLDGNSIAVDSLNGEEDTLVSLGAGTLTFNATSGPITYFGAIEGTGGLIKNGSGTQVLAGENSFTGDSAVNEGTLQVGNGDDAGTFTGDVSLVDIATFAFNRTGETTYGGALSGDGSFLKQGSGILTLTGDSSAFTGTATVAAGTLLVGAGGVGEVGGDVVVDTGATLGGSGTIGGDARVSGILSAGNSPGTLTILDDLTLYAGSTTIFELGAPGVVGGAQNDHIIVGDILTLNGALEAGVAAAGYYRLFDYGTLAPGSNFSSTDVTGTGGFTVAASSLQLDIPGQVNLSVLGAGQTLQFWDGADMDGNGTVDGGTGTWDADNTNWTGAPGEADINGPWVGSVGVFMGTAGTVTVSGTQGFDTLQFVTDGYVLSGGTLAIAPASGTTGTLSVDGGASVTIGSTIVDGSAATLEKIGGGTAILTGVNSYSGGTIVSAGILRAGSATAFVQGSPYQIDGGTLDLGGFGLTMISLSGAGGELAVGTASLTIDQSDDTAFAGEISGTGPVTKLGTGTLTLSGDSHYTGATYINGGALRAEEDYGLSDASAHYLSAGARIEVGEDVYAGIGSLQDGIGGGGDVLLSEHSALYVGYDGTATTFSGTITGDGVLEMHGGALTLTGTTDIAGLLVDEVSSLTVAGPGASFAALGDADGVGGAVVLGTLELRDQATFETQGLTLAGSMTVSGPGTSADVAGEMILVGFDPDGTLGLTISGGATMTNHGAVIIETVVPIPSFTATATVTGAGSTWTIEDDLFVGGIIASGRGALAVTAGAVVSVAGDVHIGSATELGFAPSTVTVSGAGSSLASARLIQIGGDCGCAGELGFAGSLTVSAGGSVNAQAIAIDTLGTLNFGTGGAAGTLATPAIVNNGALIANFTGEAQLAAALAGTGSFTKSGAGALNYTGNGSAFTGTTSVAGGLLSVNGALGGTVGVLSGGTLGGSGAVGALSVASGGALAPGNSIGTLSVAGNVSFAAGSTYEVEIAGSGASDKIAAGGKATLQGGTVEVTALDPATSYRNGQSFTILTAAGGVTGAFDEVVAETPFLALDLVTTANSVGLVVGVADDFTSVALTANQYATASALDTLPQTGPGLALYNALLFLPAADARRAFDLLSGEVHASVQSLFVEQSGYVRSAVIDRLRASQGGVGASNAPVVGYAPAEGATALAYAAPAGEVTSAFKAIGAPAATPGVALWGTGFGSWGEMDGNANAAGLSDRIGGFLIGADASVGTGWRVGVVGGYGSTSFDVDARSSSGDSEDWHVGFYAGNRWGDLALRSGLAYSWQRVDTTRNVAFEGFADRLTADYDAGTFQVFGELGYTIETAYLSFEPFAGLAYVRIDTGAYGEQGGAASLTGEGAGMDTGFSTLGIRIEKDIMLGEVAAQLRGTIGWRQAFGDVTPQVTQAFFGSIPFTVTGVPIAEDAALVEAGLDFTLSPSATFGLAYAAQFGDTTTQNGFNATIKIQF